MSLGSPIKAERVSTLLAKDLPPLASWIDPGILPKRGMMLAGGHAKIGKSFLALECARALATGSKLFGEFSVPQAARVLYVEQELGEYGLQKRSKKIFAGEPPRMIEENLWYVTQQPRMKLDDREGVDIFRHLVVDVKPQVLRLDPMGKLHSGDENSNQDVEKVINSVERLKKIGEPWDMSVIMIHHFGKPPQKRGEELTDELSPYQFRGASKWFDAADTLMTCSRQRDAEKKKWWELKCRFTVRHDEEQPDFVLEVNKDDDLRVKFRRSIAGVRKLVAAPLSEKPPSPPPVPGAAAAVDSSRTPLFDLQ